MPLTQCTVQPRGGQSSSTTLLCQTVSLCAVTYHALLCCLRFLRSRTKRGFLLCFVLQRCQHRQAKHLHAALGAMKEDPADRLQEKP